MMSTQQHSCSVPSSSSAHTLEAYESLSELPLLETARNTDVIMEQCDEAPASLDVRKQPQLSASPAEIMRVRWLRMLEDELPACDLEDVHALLKDPQAGRQNYGMTKIFDSGKENMFFFGVSSANR